MNGYFINAMKRTSRKPITLDQTAYDEFVFFHRNQQEVPARVKELPKDQRSKWLNKARNKFKVLEGVEGIGVPDGYGLYQKVGEEWKLHIAPNQIKTVLNHFHPHSADVATGIGAHTGYRSTYNKICTHHTGISYYDVEEHNKACPVCRDHAKIPAPEKDLIPIISHHVNERWVIDTTYLKRYQCKNYGYKYLGVVVDHFSKRVWAFLMRTKTAVEWAHHLVLLILEHDAPRIIHSDNGGEFVNSILEEIAKIFKIRLVNGGPYQPQQQGVVERMNDTLKTRLAAKMHEHKTKRWLGFLPFVLADYNMTPHSVTKITLFELFNGGRPVLVINSTTDPVNTEIQHFTAEEYQQMTTVKRERFNKLQVLAEDRLIINGEVMRDKFIKNKPSKFEVGAHVAIKYTAIAPKGANGKPPKLQWGEKRWPMHGEIVEQDKKGRFVIKLSTGELFSRAVKRKELKRVNPTLSNTNQDQVSDGGSSASSSSETSDSNSLSNASTTSSSVSDSDVSAESSQSIKDGKIEQIREASATRRKQTAMEKPAGMSWTRFFNELGQNPNKFKN